MATSPKAALSVLSLSYHTELVILIFTAGSAAGNHSIYLAENEFRASVSEVPSVAAISAEVAGSVTLDSIDRSMAALKGEHTKLPSPAIAFAALKNFVSKPAIFSTALSSARLNSGGNTTSFIFVYQ